MLTSHKARLIKFGRGAMVSLTAVIPVATTIKSVVNLDQNISRALKNNIRVILIVDQVSEISNQQLEKIQQKYIQKSSHFCIKRGLFASPGGARNEGIRHAETEFITFWDADDLVNVDELARVLGNCDGKFDYVVGSYEMRDSQSGISRLVFANRGFPRLRIINQPGVWRIVFRRSQVKDCCFGTTRMGEDQVYIAKSGLLNSSRVLFSDVNFYSYFLEVDGQLTSSRRMNLALLGSIIEILRSFSIKDRGELSYKTLIVCRLFATLAKRLLMGKL
jgi:glycosyltransferase involved in cell wall biosynthesis